MAHRRSNKRKDLRCQSHYQSLLSIFLAFAWFGQQLMMSVLQVEKEVIILQILLPQPPLSLLSRFCDTHQELRRMISTIGCWGLQTN